MGKFFQLFFLILILQSPVAGQDIMYGFTDTQLYEVDLKSGDIELIFEFGELWITASAVDSHGDIYVTTWTDEDGSNEYLLYKIDLTDKTLDYVESLGPKKPSIIFFDKQDNLMVYGYDEGFFHEGTINPVDSSIWENSVNFEKLYRTGFYDGQKHEYALKDLDSSTDIESLAFDSRGQLYAYLDYDETAGQLIKINQLDFTYTAIGAIQEDLVLDHLVIPQRIVEGAYLAHAPYQLYFEYASDHLDSAKQIIVLKNVGNQPLSIDAITGSSENVSVFTGTGTLNGGESTVIEVFFKATSTGTYHGELQIKSEANSLSVPLEGKFELLKKIENFNKLPVNKLYVQNKGSVYESIMTRNGEIFSVDVENPLMLTQSPDGYIYRYYYYEGTGAGIFLFDPVTLERTLLEGTEVRPGSGIGFDMATSQTNMLYWLRDQIFQYDLISRAISAYDNPLESGAFGPNSGASYSGIAVNPLTGNLLYSNTIYQANGNATSNIRIENENHELLEEIQLPYAIWDFAFDVYGELYGAVDGYLHHIDLSKKVITKVSDQQIDRMFSAISEPKSYALAPKGIYLDQIKTGQFFTGQLKLKNHTSDNFVVERIHTTSPNVSLSNISLPLTVGIAEQIYVDYEVSAATEQEFDEYIIAELTTDEGPVLDSIRIEGLVYAQRDLTENTFYGYSTNRFTAQDLANSTQELLNSIELPLQAATVTPSGQGYAFSDDRLYSLDIFSGDANQIAHVFKDHELYNWSVHDLSAKSNSELMVLFSSFSDWRGSSKSISVGEYRLESDTLITLKRLYSRASDGTYTESSGIEISTMAFSKETNTFFLSEGDSLYRWQVEDSVLWTAGKLGITDAELIDLFVDETDDLYGIFKIANKTYLAQVGKYSGSIQLIAEVPTSSIGLATSIANMNVTGTDPQPDAEIQVFPNPTEHTFFVKSGRPLAGLILYDAAGRLRHGHTLTPTSNSIYQVRLNPDHTRPGLYILQLQYEDGSFHTYRIMIR